MRTWRSAPHQGGFAFALLALLLALGPLGYVRGETAVAPPPAKPETAAKSLFQRVVELNRIQEPELDGAAAQQALETLLARLKPALAAAGTPREKIAALNRILLGEREVSYLSNMYWRDATLAASLLRGRGNCLSTSTLYVVVGDALGLPLRMVTVPRHAFVRWDDGQTRINIETTAGGKERDDREYLGGAETTPEDIELLGWGRSLSRDEFLAELYQTAAAHRQGENKLEEAMRLLEQAEALAGNRSDRTLRRLRLMADITGKRTEAREQVLTLLRGERKPPPSVVTGALLYLAEDAAGAGDHQAERRFLLAAFKEAPKTSQSGVLQQLAFCHRALKDFRGAVRYMELAAALMEPGDPNNATVLYNLAILQKNDKRLGDALRSIRAAMQLNPESWNLKMIEAGYMVLDGQREQGLARFAAIERPRGDLEFYEIMLTWFYAVSQQREKFYAQFEQALSLARSTNILEWIDQDVDLDVYRNEPEFKALVTKHAVRLRGK